MSRFTVMLTQKELRDGVRYSQRDIARETGISAPVISRWMKGDIDGASLVTVRKFCEWLECDIGELITMKQEPA